jgi:hypothetical protein
MSISKNSAPRSAIVNGKDEIQSQDGVALFAKLW